MRDIILSKRLSTAASFVRSGAVCADIGTDHSYVPIHLVLSGIVKKAIASDVNEGPTLIAKENVKKYGLDDKIIVRTANGLDGIEEYKPTDILICGMGGELISEILNRSEYVKNNEVRLILQPMTAIKELREYLSHGYKITDETLVFDADKLYQVICAEYDGMEHTYTDIELELGKINIEKREELFSMLVKNTLKKRRKRFEGLKVGGYQTDDLEKEILELEAML